MRRCGPAGSPGNRHSPGGGRPAPFPQRRCRPPRAAGHTHPPWPQASRPQKGRGYRPAPRLRAAASTAKESGGTAPSDRPFMQRTANRDGSFSSRRPSGTGGTGGARCTSKRSNGSAWGAKPCGQHPCVFRRATPRKERKLASSASSSGPPHSRAPLPAHLQGRKLSRQKALHAPAFTGGIHRMHHRRKKRCLPQTAEIFHLVFPCHLSDHSAFTSSL